MNRPDTWVIVKINSKEYPPVYKVLAGWYGGYTGANSWKMSSGLLRIEHREGDTVGINASGSEYLLNGEPRLSGLTAGVLNSYMEDLKTVGATIDIFEGFPTEEQLKESNNVAQH